MSAQRSIEHGKRNGFATMEKGRLNFESFPMRLYFKGNKKFWNPADIDFSQDAEDFASMTPDEKRMTCALAAHFMGGEESVTQDLQPFVAAMAAEGRFADELYLTQFIFEEAKHTEAFRRWFNAIGMTDDLHEHVEFSEPYKEMFMKHLPESLYALTNDPSPANQIRASVTYNHIVEGTLALTGYYAWEKVCRSRGILPGMQQVIKHIGDDERRHMAWGTFTCRRHVAADERNWDVVEERMQELLQPALQFIATLFEQFDEVPFGISLDEMTEYAVDKVSRRLGSIESARGANVLDIDIDASPEALEEKFHVEDEAHIASIMPVAG
jgi:ribonucleoside-diphosphate reductase beta chain